MSQLVSCVFIITIRCLALLEPFYVLLRGSHTPQNQLSSVIVILSFNHFLKYTGSVYITMLKYVLSVNLDTPMVL